MSRSLAAKFYLIKDPQLRSNWQDIGTARFAQATQNPIVTNCGVTPIYYANEQPRATCAKP